MKPIVSNTALIIGSILLTYVILEGLFRFALPYLPMSLFNNECRELRTVGQTSKKGKNPSPEYLAIIGDSYGAGQGDWFTANRYNLNSRYQAAHVIEDILERDVVSYSKAGAGNYDGGAIFAENTFLYLNRAGFDFPPPKIVVVYFYEGNDVSDNLRFMQRYYLPSFDEKRIFDDAYFARFSDEMRKRFVQGELPRLQDAFLVGNLLSRAVEGFIYSSTKNDPIELPGTKYPALINGEQRMLPDSVEGNSIDIDDQQLAFAVRFFERALAQIAFQWPESRKFVVYIPAPLTTYDLKDAATTQRMQCSHLLEKMIVLAARKNSFNYIDVVRPIREKAKSEYVHGPRDWNHFNRKGYEVLGRTIAKAVAAE